MITKRDIERVFNDQLEKIKDKGLREKVVQTWIKGCTQGKWDSIDQLEKMPFTLLVDSKGVSFIEHTIAVTEGAAHLARTQLEYYNHIPYQIDFDTLYAGGLLHDVGKLMETAIFWARREKGDIEIGVCGEQGGEPNSVRYLHGIGVNYVSCSPFRIPVAKLVAAQAAVQDRINRAAANQ